MIKCCAQKWCEPLENCLIPNTTVDQSHSHGGGYWVEKKAVLYQVFLQQSNKSLSCPQMPSVPAGVVAIWTVSDRIYPGGRLLVL